MLDLFAGVGSMGLESLSRGAERVLMVEQDRKIFKILESNVEMLGCGDRADLLCGDALGSVAILRAPRPIRVAFVDPPFKMMEGESTRTRVLDQVQRIAPLLTDDAIIVLRTPVDAEEVDLTIEGLAGPEAHRHRKNHEVMLYGPEQSAEADIEEVHGV